MAKISIKDILTGFITSKPKAKVNKNDIDMEDSNTDMPTPQSVRYQLFLRTLGEDYGLGLPYYRSKADKIESLMWSYKRQSRKEAVEALATQQVKEMMGAGIMPNPEQKIQFEEDKHE